MEMFIRNWVLLMLVIIGQTTLVYNFNLPEYIQSENKIGQLIEEKEFQVHQTMRRYHQLVFSSQNKARKEDYIANPLTASVLIRRLAEDWTSLASLTGGHSALSSMGLENVRWPEQRDVTAACKTLERVQACYYLSTEAMAQGRLASSQVTTNLTAADCYNMGLHYYNSVHFAEATQWLQQALSNVGDGDDSANVRDVMLHLAPSLCFSGDYEGSMSVATKLQRFYPDHTLPEHLAEDYRKMAAKNCGSLHEVFTVMKQEMLSEKQWNGSREVHKQLCQAPGRLPDRLRCRYVHYQQAHLRFQPFKLEELRLDPPVLRFYDVLSDEESSALKKAAMKKMKVAMTVGADGQAEVSDFRTSSVAWLPVNTPDVAEVGTRLKRRIADMTRLNPKATEDYQLSRYGVGGEFLPHLDFFHMAPYVLNRLATLMFYLNDVKQGGNTVFLQWGLSVPPVRNSAILWFHFLPNGDKDETSEHSGCPVLEGSKWVLNQWILNGGNEFLMPCGLNRDASYKEYYQ